MPSTPSPRESMEMILLTLARAEERGTVLTAETLAREWQDTSESLLQTLRDQSLITQNARGVLTLTPSGRERARALLRHHRLVEQHATQVLGLDWTRAHEHADQIEHHISAEEADALADQLGHPITCPHGNPIPSTTREETSSEALVSLATCPARTRGVIARINAETTEALHHLATLGLLPNVTLVVEHQAPFGGPVLVRVGHSHYALGRDLAQRIWIKTETT
ncbi:MAG: metal-dependent transcriptional regulator [Anaerolineae bacterium]|nr:metal-dependent transcriptional regulator [Anaerolineae bacterium]